MTNDGRKSHGCFCKATGMRRTSSRRSIRLYPGQNGKCTIIVKNFRSQNVQIVRYVCPLERNLYGHPSAGLLWERQFEKILLKIRLGRSSKLGMLVCKPRKRLFLSVYVDDMKLAVKKENIGKYLCGRTNIYLLTKIIRELYSTRMSN